MVCRILTSLLTICTPNPPMVQLAVSRRSLPNLVQTSSHMVLVRPRPTMIVCICSTHATSRPRPRPHSPIKGFKLVSCLVFGSFKIVHRMRHCIIIMVTVVVTTVVVIMITATMVLRLPINKYPSWPWTVTVLKTAYANGLLTMVLRFVGSLITTHDLMVSASSHLYRIIQCINWISSPMLTPSNLTSLLLMMHPITMLLSVNAGSVQTWRQIWLILFIRTPAF